MLLSVIVYIFVIVFKLFINSPRSRTAA